MKLASGEVQVGIYRQTRLISNFNFNHYRVLLQSAMHMTLHF